MILERDLKFKSFGKSNVKFSIESAIIDQNGQELPYRDYSGMYVSNVSSPLN